MLNMKLFSLEGAHQLIPRLEKYISRLRELKTLMLQKQVQIDTSLIVGVVSDSTRYAASQSNVTKDVQALNALIKEFNGILAEISNLGCQLKDVETGLIDLYFIHNDNIVNLCWKSGETQIQFWHPLDKGFKDRKKL